MILWYYKTMQSTCISRYCLQAMWDYKTNKTNKTMILWYYDTIRLCKVLASADIVYKQCETVILLWPA